MEGGERKGKGEWQAGERKMEGELKEEGKGEWKEERKGELKEDGRRRGKEDGMRMKGKRKDNERSVKEILKQDA